MHFFIAQGIFNVFGALQVALEQHITHQCPLFMALDEFIYNRLKLGAVLAKGPGNFSAFSDGNVVVHFNLVKNLGPEMCFVAVHDDHRNKAGVDHFQQIFILKKFFRHNQFYRRFTVFFKGSI